MIIQSPTQFIKQACKTMPKIKGILIGKWSIIVNQYYLETCLNLPSIEWQRLNIFSIGRCKNTTNLAIFFRIEVRNTPCQRLWSESLRRANSKTKKRSSNRQFHCA
mmetsp:Transcript_28578/g.59861  ORF Transcript_28578/g.59861 Transcript_28578/m.59861 type:complete len:106 (+) Transcript_28578:1647-1964(+)